MSDKRALITGVTGQDGSDMADVERLSSAAPMGITA